ncbi:MAG: hypothetical protein AAF533_13565 [Acidobacteriota bacterium]
MSSAQPAQCKVRSQFDGVTRCPEPAVDLGFCEFCRDALDRGDIDLDGVLSDGCVDQVRRREITYYPFRGKMKMPEQFG